MELKIIFFYPNAYFIASARIKSCHYLKGTLRPFGVPGPTPNSRRPGQRRNTGQRQAGRLGEKPRKEGPGGLPEGGVWGWSQVAGAEREEEVLW